MTAKQTRIIEAMRALEFEGVSPTVRSLTDRLESRKHRSERWTVDETRGLLERLEKDGHVVQFSDEAGRQRYRLPEGGPDAA